MGMTIKDCYLSDNADLVVLKSFARRPHYRQIDSSHTTRLAAPCVPKDTRNHYEH